MTEFTFTKSIDREKGPELLKRKSYLQQESNLSEEAIRDRLHKTNFKTHTSQI